MARTGRPAKYDPKKNRMVTGMCLLGSTDEQLAEHLEIDISNFYKWQTRYPDFREAIKRGRVEADAKVAVKMYEKSLGYKHKSVKIFYDPKAAESENEAFNKALFKWEADGMTGPMPEPPGEDAGVVKVDYIEHYPPDTAAAKFILTNRQGDKWKDKQEVTNKGETKVVHQIDWEPSANCDPIIDTPEADDITGQ